MGLTEESNLSYIFIINLLSTWGEMHLYWEDKNPKK